MRIILAGKHELACELYKILSDKKVVLGVILCQSEDSKNRQSLSNLLKKNQIKLLGKATSHKVLQKLVEDFKPDIFISAGFDKIIKSDLLKKIPYPVNIHFGLLPKYRGSFSIPWAIINNEKFIGVTLHKIDPGIDTGPVILQQKIINDPNKSCQQLYLECLTKAKEMLKVFLDQTETNRLKFKSQNESRSSFYKFEIPFSFQIDWSKNCLFIYNLIRAAYFPPYKPALSRLNQKRIYFNFPIKKISQKNIFPAGQIVKVRNNFMISVPGGFIQPEDIAVGSNKIKFREYCLRKKLIGKIFD